MNRVTAAAIAILGMTFTAGVNAAEADRGALVFHKWCTPCHGEGRTHPGTLALGAKYRGNIPAELEKRTDLDSAQVAFFVRNGVSIMPFFRKTEISDEDLRALSAYLSKSR